LGDNNIRPLDLLPAAIDDWTRQDSVSSFDRETIFKYINGAGEVYNSYAFSEVTVVRYAREDSSEIVVELFDMGNDNDAFGAFSYAREDEQSGIGGGYEQRGRVLCFWQSQYYVCLAATQPVVDTLRSLRTLAVAISARLPNIGDRPQLLRLLPEVNLEPNSERFFHLHQSLNYHYYLNRENILKLSRETDAVLARYRPGGVSLLIVEYPSESEARTTHKEFTAFYASIQEEAAAASEEPGKYPLSIQHGPFIGVVLGAFSQEQAMTLLNSVILGVEHHY